MSMLILESESLTPQRSQLGLDWSLTHQLTVCNGTTGEKAPNTIDWRCCGITFLLIAALFAKQLRGQFYFGWRSYFCQDHLKPLILNSVGSTVDKQYIFVFFLLFCFYCLLKTTKKQVFVEQEGCQNHSKPPILNCVGFTVNKQYISGFFLPLFSTTKKLISVGQISTLVGTTWSLHH